MDRLLRRDLRDLLVGQDERVGTGEEQFSDLHEAVAFLSRYLFEPAEMVRLRRILAEQQPDLPLRDMKDTEVVARAASSLLSRKLRLVQQARVEEPAPSFPSAETQAEKEEEEECEAPTMAPVCEEPETVKGPGTLTVVVQDQHGNPVEGADVSVNGTNKGLTDSSGRLYVGEVPEGIYSIDAFKNGYEEAGVMESVGADTCVTATVLLGTYQITQVTPTTGTESSPDKWYVNLPDSVMNSQGREVEIKALVSPVKSGISIDFKIEEHSGNYSKALLATADQAKVVTASATTDVNGVAKTKLSLSLCGMDKFRVIASINGVAGSDRRSGWVQVWRKLYYQQTRMKTTYSFPFTNVTGEYAKYGIEISSSGAVVESTYQANLETSELQTYAETYHKKRQPPFEAHILLIDRQCDSKEETLTTDQTVASKDYTFTDDVWPFTGWLVSAKWKEKSGGSWSNSNITVTRSGTKITVDLSATGVDPTASTISIEVKVKLIKGEYTGDATYKPHVFIAIGKPRSNASKSKTVNHEIGHGIGMVPTSGHTLQYSNDNGGMGSHCRSGATPNQASKAQGGTFSGRYSGGTCVMYHASSENYSYCATCAPFVKKCKLAKTDMEGRGWG